MFVWSKGELDPKQEAAVCEKQSVFLVACPGSGKTRTLTYKIAFELSKLESRKKWILAITYTNRAANEIQDRVESMGVNTDQLWIGTIHSFCLEWIIKPYGIYHDQLKFGYRIVNAHDKETILADLCGVSPLPKVTHFDCNHFFDSAGLRIACNDYRRENVESVLHKYHALVKENRQVDFELILWYSYELVIQQPLIRKLLSKIFSYVFVDEYQDTKEIQYQILASVMKTGRGKVKAFIVGDPNQAIFTTLGGYAISIEALSEMTGIKFYPMELSANYRSSQRVVDYFSHFKVFDSKIESHADHRLYPSLISYDRQTSRHNLIDEIARLIRLNIEECGFSPNEVCVVGPWWIHLASLTRGLVGALPEYSFDGPGLTPFGQDTENIWYKLARLVLTKPSPTRYLRRLRWSKEVISILSDADIDVLKLSTKGLLREINQIKVDEQDGLAYLQIFFDELFEKLNIVYRDFPVLQEHHDAFFQSSKSRIDRIRGDGFEYAGDIESFHRAFESRTGVTVSSIHGVKGTEFDAVISFAMLEDIVPHFSDPNPRDSAKKLLYVIGSRARKNLHLISEQGRKQGHPTNELSALRFDYSEIVDQQSVKR